MVLISLIFLCAGNLDQTSHLKSHSQTAESMTGAGPVSKWITTAAILLLEHGAGYYRVIEKISPLTTRPWRTFL